MGKKVKRTKTTEAQQVKQVQVEAPKTEAKVEGKATATASVKALEFLRKLHLDWVLERKIEPGDLEALRAKVNTGEDGPEWASWWIAYTRADGNPVKGLAWSVAAPMAGGYIVLRLIEDRVVKATMRVWPSGKGTIRGVPAIVQALASRPDLPEWTEQDTAALL
ncbi:hypothetical protein [Escherichia coli]|uniref:hypothetical protein n=1 Tax=Escherichia coli TaxID=562 RepID=UPI000F04698D|nr:hypothetical protein [Escherichia coli]